MSDLKEKETQNKKEIIKEMTPEIEAKIPIYKENATRDIYNRNTYRKFNLLDATKAVEWNYAKSNFAIPVVLSTENALEMQLMRNLMALNYKYYQPTVKKILKLKTTKERATAAKELQTTVENDIKKYMSSRNSDIFRDYLKEKSDSYVFTMNIYSPALYAWWSFIRDEFNVPLEEELNKDFEEGFALQREAGIYAVITGEEVAIVSRHPKSIYQDESNNWVMHNTKGQAVEWNYTFQPYDCYYINGRVVEKELFEGVLNKTFTFDQFNELDNEDQRAAVMTLIRENHGEQGMLEFLKAEKVDSWTVDHGDHDILQVDEITGEYSISGEKRRHVEILELYKTKDKHDWAMDSKGNLGAQLAWLHEICPSTGSHYFINVPPEIKTAEAAAKYARPSRVPDSVPLLWNSAN